MMEIEHEIADTSRGQDADHAAHQRFAVDRNGCLGANVSEWLEPGAETCRQEERARRPDVSVRHPFRRRPCPDRRCRTHYGAGGRGSDRSR